MKLQNLHQLILTGYGTALVYGGTIQRFKMQGLYIAANMQTWTPMFLTD